MNSLELAPGTVEAVGLYAARCGALIVGVPRETAPGERRVAMTPDTVKRLTASGVVVKIESGAGLASGHSDDAYVAAGATIVADAVEALKSGPGTLAEVAADLGYADQAHFTHDFRTVTGMTPGEYLKDQPRDQRLRPPRR